MAISEYFTQREDRMRHTQARTTEGRIRYTVWQAAAPRMASPLFFVMLLLLLSVGAAHADGNVAVSSEAPAVPRYSSSVSVAASVPFTLTAHNPLANAVGVDVGQNITANFDAASWPERTT